MLLLLTSLFFYRTSHHRSLSSSGYCGHAVSHRKIRHVFRLWGSNLSQFFRVQFKGVRLELLAPICKREQKKKTTTSALFLLSALHPALDGGVNRLYTKAFERVTDRKARGLQTQEIGCKHHTFFISLLSSRRKQTSVIFFSLLYTNLKRGFS